MDSLNPAVLKDVIVIGNGPSAITLSYMLAGNWPYYNGQQHPIEFLQSKLETDQDKSLIEQDLNYLSEGLEGRSENPVSVLFDTLTHYEADLGIDTPSFLKWKHNELKAIDHVVIGNGQPGGTWQLMEGSTLTISPGKWMELPNMSFRDWNSSCNKDANGMKQARAVVGSVATYFKDYVQLKNLSPYFRNNSFVTSVQRVESEDGQEMWQVDGIDNKSRTGFSYISPSVVLATGTHNKPNRLSIPGEDLPFVMHSLPALEKQLETDSIDKLLIVGAGLSAADAILTAGYYNVPVCHVFRRDVTDPKIIFNQLPENMYPEYHRVHRMMKTGGAGYNQGYKSMCSQQVREIRPDGTVLLSSTDSAHNELSIIKVSHVCVLIGSKPDLKFFPKKGFKLGLNPAEHVDSKSNPIDVNVYTHESFNYPGIYALGPLVGDNFVRFLQGGALAITNHLHSVKDT